MSRESAEWSRSPFAEPVDSEAQLAKDAEILAQKAMFHQEKALEARRYADEVFGSGAWRQ